ncbi:MAG: putative stage IV sporulation protein YqfD [Firmicutes bacterium ADurb.Bin506]|nr:MAG: putative stage IV sporulation protein YqfD [Firmicutes bacterium ADurb.Bin506]
MGRPGVWEWIRGYVIIVVTGGSVGEFLSKCMGRGIEFSDVGFIGPCSIIARVSIADYRCLVEAQRASSCRVQSLGRGGAPFLLQSVARRKTALVGTVAFFVVMLVLASFIWRIDVTGASEERALQIVGILESRGIVPRIRRRVVDCDAVRALLWTEVEGLAFVSVELHGVVLRVHIAEKDIIELPEGPVDLVAAEDAVITNMIVLEGKAHASVGQSVARGDLLVSAPASSVPSKAQARAIVQGRVWREFTAVVPRTVVTRLRTGRIARRLMLIFDGRGVVLPWPASFEQYDLEERSVRAGRVELKWRTLHELVTDTVEMTRDEAASMAMAQARTEAMTYIGGGADVAAVTEMLIDTDDGSVKAVITVETVQDIARAASRRAGAK